MKYLTLRRQLIETARAMNRLGINQGTSGNVSVRSPDGRGILVTPSGADYDTLTAADIVAMGLDGKWTCERPGRRPSSEWQFHLDILAARPEFGAVVHCHARHATALACLGRAIPAFHYMVAAAGGDSIRCAPYATFGTPELSAKALTALKNRRACLLANHGLIAAGGDLRTALALAVEVESLAAQYVQVLTLGKPRLLSKAEMRRVLAKFRDYGYGQESAPKPRP